MFPATWIRTSVIKIIGAFLFLHVCFVSASSTERSPYIHEIRVVNEHIKEARKAHQELNSEHGDQWIKMTEIIRGANPDEMDIWKLLLEIKSVAEEAVQGIKAGQSRQVVDATGHMAQLGLDLWTSWAERTKSPLGPVLKGINVAQQGGWELARMIQNRVEAAKLDGSIEENIKILKTLVQKERDYINNSKSKSSKPGTVKKPPTPPKDGNSNQPKANPGEPDLSELDNAVLELDRADKQHYSEFAGTQIGFDHPERLSPDEFRGWLTHQEKMRKETMSRSSGRVTGEAVLAPTRPGQAVFVQTEPSAGAARPGEAIFVPGDNESGTPPGTAIFDDRPADPTTISSKAQHSAIQPASSPRSKRTQQIDKNTCWKIHDGLMGEADACRKSCDATSLGMWKLIDCSKECSSRYNQQLDQLRPKCGW